MASFDPHRCSITALAGQRAPASPSAPAADTQPAAPPSALAGLGVRAPAGCAAATRPAKAAPSAALRAKIEDHPCYSEDAHHHFARLHLPVAPRCNIQCHYCNRKFDCANESRPGVTSARLTPLEAREKALRVAAAMPQLSVIGIAGPGDGLADPERTLETFRLIKAELPHLKLCLSTNGLALPEHVDDLRALGVDHVTITMNALDPAVGAGIYAWARFGGERLEGAEAAACLIERQRLGLERLAAAGALVKVNSVLIPGVNDEHLVELNRVVREQGAFLHNVIPLISDPAHGTHYGLTGQREPTAAELESLRARLGEDGRLMRHCRQCRADAAGLIGQDQGAQLDAAAAAEPAEPRPDAAAATAYRAVVAQERGDRRQAAREAARRLAAALGDGTAYVAVCSKGGGRVNQHFGHAEELQIFRADRRGVRFVDHRRIDRYCGGETDKDDVMAAVRRALDGVPVILCAKIGERPRRELAEAGVAVVDAYAFDYIETAVARLVVDRASGDAERAVA